MAGGLTFAQLVTRVQNGSITPTQVENAFTLDAAATTGLHPRFRINPDFVDISGLEGTAADAAHALAVEAGYAVRSSQPTPGPAPDGTMVAEGDSWFRLPHVVCPPTLADVLAEDYPITNLAHWGDELSTMYNRGKGQYVPALKAGQIKTLLFSGGGNDILGSTFELCLNIFSVDHADPADAAYYPTPFFYQKLADVQRIYEGILDQIARFSPQTLLVVHGYDYAIPRGNGSFLGIHMQNRGLYPTYQPDLCRAIIRVMINLFNERLAYLAHHHPSFHHVDLRGTVEEDDWFDGEIHPNADAARRLAAKVAAVLGPPARPSVVAAASIPAARRPRGRNKGVPT